MPRRPNDLGACLISLPNFFASFFETSNPKPQTQQSVEVVSRLQAGQSDRHRDRLHELKIRMAVEAYEQRRPADTVMHHYWVKDRGPVDCVQTPTG